MTLRETTRLAELTLAIEFDKQDFAIQSRLKFMEGEQSSEPMDM